MDIGYSFYDCSTLLSLVPHSHIHRVSSMELRDTEQAKAMYHNDQRAQNETLKSELCFQSKRYCSGVHMNNVACEEGWIEIHTIPGALYWEEKHWQIFRLILV